MASRNPWLAAVLSFVVAGLGQLYAGRNRRALAFFALEILTAGVAYSFQGMVSDAGTVLNIAVSIVAAGDAYRIAKNMPSQPRGSEKEYYVDS
ncbi:MAG: hypothetical protein V1921_07045 [Candidatus Altiarchaeota archaeon]